MDLFLTNMQLFTSQEEIDVMQNFSKSDEETNSSTSWYILGTWGWVHFQLILILGWTIPLNMNSKFLNRSTL